MAIDFFPDLVILIHTIQCTNFQVISKTLLYGYSIKVEWRSVRRLQLHHIGLQSLYTALHIATKCNKISKCSKNIEAHQSIRLRCSGSHSMSVRVADICQDTVRDIQRRNHVLSLRLTSPVHASGKKNKPHELCEVIVL